MGFTRYMTVDSASVHPEFRHEFPQDFVNICRVLLSYADRHYPIIFSARRDLVEVGGSDEDHTCESIHLVPLFSHQEAGIYHPFTPSPLQTGYYTCFVKTNRLPYDDVVAALMLLTRMWFGDGITLTSDDDDGDDTMYFVYEHREGAQDVYDALPDSISHSYTKGAELLHAALFESVKQEQQMTICRFLSNGASLDANRCCCDLKPLLRTCTRLASDVTIIRTCVSPRAAVDVWKDTDLYVVGRGLSEYIDFLTRIVWRIVKVHTECKYHPSKIDFDRLLSEQCARDQVEIGVTLGAPSSSTKTDT